jgi:hypothetical protein
MAYDTPLPSIGMRAGRIQNRHVELGLNALVFGSPSGEFQGSFKTAWESLPLFANGHDTTRAKPGARVDRAKLRQVDLHWHDVRHEASAVSLLTVRTSVSFS